MKLSTDELNILLIRFGGHKLTKPPSNAKDFFMSFFTQQTINTFHSDISLDITEILALYKTYYQQPGASFNAYLYYTLIQTMKKEDFSFLRHRFINDTWYEFDNPAVFFAVGIDEPTIQQVDFFIESPANLSWSEFVKVYATNIRACRLTQAPGTPEKQPCWYHVSHHMTSMPFSFVSYTPSQKQNDLYAHAPWFVFSQRETSKDNQVFLTVSCTLSHASALPSDLSRFLHHLRIKLSEVPDNQKITHYFSSQTPIP